MLLLLLLLQQLLMLLLMLQLIIDHLVMQALSTTSYFRCVYKQHPERKTTRAFILIYCVYSTTKSALLQFCS